jgi:hypothetical protein
MVRLTHPRRADSPSEMVDRRGPTISEDVSRHPLALQAVIERIQRRSEPPNPGGTTEPPEHCASRGPASSLSPQDRRQKELSSAVVQASAFTRQRRQPLDLVIVAAPNEVNGHKRPSRLVRIE